MADELLIKFQVAYKVNPVALQEMMDSPQGPVVKDLIARSERVWAPARNQVRLGHIHAGTKAPTGGPARPNLKYSIVRRMDFSKKGEPRALVGSDNPIALLHHEGTKPHIIVPRTATVLAFWSGTAERTVFRKRVQHPGTKPNRYLTDNLRLAGG